MMDARPITIGDAYRLADGLPVIAAPPGFRWAPSWSVSHPVLTRALVHSASGRTTAAALGIDDMLARSQAERDEIAIATQAVIAQRAVRAMIDGAFDAD